VCQVRECNLKKLLISLILTLVCSTYEFLGGGEGWRRWGWGEMSCQVSMFFDVI
jgi:hypothetical protein